MAELYGTLGQTTLNGAIADSDTSITVTSAAGFLGGETYESGGVLRGRLDDGVNVEIIKITNISGAVLTVVRGQEGTTAAAFADLTPLKQVVTAAALDAIRADSVTSGVLASIPSNPKTGDVYLSSDTPLGLRFNGSSWEQHGLLYRMIPPTSGDFAWLNQGSATVSQATNGPILLSVPPPSSTNVRGRYKAVPSAPYTVIVSFSLAAGAIGEGGLFLYESSSGKLVTFVATGGVIFVQKWNSVSAWSANYTSTGGTQNTAIMPLVHFKLVDDATNRIISYSADRINWVPLHSVGRTDFITPDNIGFYVDSTGSNLPVALTLWHWAQS